jgi:anti-sigma factor (TIGR02949 family)
MTAERVVAGLRCTEVLALLVDYLDGELSPADARQLEAHVAGCDQCARFGGRYAGVVRGLQEQLAEDVPPEVVTRLTARLG